MSLIRALDALERGDKVGARAALAAMGPAVLDDALALQAMAVCGEGDGALSMAYAERAVRLAPGDAQAHFNLAVTLQARDHLARAMLHYDQALALAPDHIGALNNLSDLMRRRGRPEEGWTLMQRFLALGAPERGMELRLAKLAMDTHRLDEARLWFARAEAAAPDDPSPRFEAAMASLLVEDFATGWSQYEARIPLYGRPALAMHDHGLPDWDGRLDGAGPVLIHREQGLGDTLMFAAALPSLVSAGADLHLAVDPSQVRLFKQSLPKAKVWGSRTYLGVANAPQPFRAVCGPLSAQAPFGSLGALRMADGPPKPAAYLQPPPEALERFAALMNALRPRRRGVRRLGLVFSARRSGVSDDSRTNGAHKSIPPADLAPLADIANVDWFGLHGRDTAAQLADVPGLSICDLSPFLTDFADTAAAILNLDHVVTVDTAVAHLAGALGAPTTVLLWRNADWRWGLHRTDSRWYPHVQLLRQTTYDRWSNVVDRLGKVFA